MSARLLLRAAGLAVLAVLATAGCTHAPEAGVAPGRAAAGRRAQLRQALAQADRMSIAPAAPGAPTPPVREFRSAAVVRDFLDNMAIDESYGPVRCDCPDDAVFTFYAGDRAVATLSLRRLGYLHWAGGPWEGDAVLTAEAAQWLQQWSRQAGCDLTLTLQALALRENQKAEAAKARLLADFNPEARKLFAAADTVVYRGRQLRRIETPLAAAYGSADALAEAGLRALADTPQRWLEDDWAVGAIQTALLDLDPKVVLAAMDRLRDQENALLGAARFFFRTGFGAQLPAAVRDPWALKLADLVLRAGRDSDKPALLEYFAALPGDATAGFLRALASGGKSYPFAEPCDELTPDLEEPGLPYAAALLLAGRADPQSRTLLAALRARHPFGPDAAALEVSGALLQAGAPLAAADFKYRSRLLGLEALKALAWRAGPALTLDLVAAACGHFEPDVAAGAQRIAGRYGLQRAEDPAGENVPEYDPLLAETAPHLAVREYSAALLKASGQTLAQLYALRGEAYANLGELSAAEADYLNVVKTPFADGTDVRTRLAWIQWYLGEFDEAAQTIDAGLQAAPGAELVLLRGIMRYSLEQFGDATDADLTAAAVLEPDEGYAELFQHLAANLSGHPERSRLRTYLAGAPAVPDWPRQLIGFMLGHLDADRLMELAAASDPGEVAWHTCEASFYISQAARLAGRTDDERSYLERCVATGQTRVAEFWVARFRLQKLRPSGPTLPGRTRETPPSAI